MQSCWLPLRSCCCCVRRGASALTGKLLLLLLLLPLAAAAAAAAWQPLQALSACRRCSAEAPWSWSMQRPRRGRAQWPWQRPGLQQQLPALAPALQAVEAPLVAWPQRTPPSSLLCT